MKKIVILLVVAFAISLLPAQKAFAEDKKVFQDIKKAVKENPNYQDGSEAKWFKVLITDEETKKDKVKITLPLSLVELFIRAAHDKHMQIHREDYDLDLKEIFQELKKLGPMALIEVYEDGEIIKIWLE